MSNVTNTDEFDSTITCFKATYSARQVIYFCFSQAHEIYEIIFEQIFSKLLLLNLFVSWSGVHLKSIVY